jgi:hypothetical protein
MQEMNRFLKIFALFVVAFAAMQSCGKLYKEDMSDCYAGVSVTLLIDPSTTGAAEAEAAAESAILYIFDGEGNFLERRETNIGQPELLLFPDAGPITVVGVINDGSFDVTAWADDMLRNQGLAALKTDGDYNRIPSDLFYGEANFINESTSLNEEHGEVLATRRTGQANVTVRGLQDYAGIDDENFYIVTKNTGSGMDFYGNLTGYGAIHTPQGAFNIADEYLTGNFGVMATDGNTPMTIEIWHRDPTTGVETFIYSTSAHRDGASIHIVNDQTTNILIDFRTGISIRIEQSEWGVSFPWKTFN